jgi:hypothetical protein
MESRDASAAPSSEASTAPTITPPPPSPPPPKKTIREHFRHSLRTWRGVVAAVLIAAASYLLIGFRELISHWTLSKAIEAVAEKFHYQPKRSRVLAVFPDPTSSTVSVPILDALFKGPPAKQTLIDGVDLVYVPEGRSKEDTAATLKAEIAKGDVILVIGHVTSTVAQYLDQTVYHERTVVGNTPMPLILPAATNPQLTSAEPADEQHILRLPATDVAQIKCIRSFLLRLLTHKNLQRPASVGIIRDASNPTYSEYIGDEIVAKSDDVDMSVGANLGGADIPMTSMLDHDVVVVAGMERLSKVLLKRIYRRDKSIGDDPELLFTDGVAGEVFYTATASVLRDRAVKDKSAPKGAPPIDLVNQHVWMSGPFEPRDHGGIWYKKGERLPDKPDYYSYGELASGVAKKLLDDARRTHKGKLSRESVLETLRSWLKNSGQQPEGVQFDSKGDNTKSECHVFRIGAGTYAHADYCCCDEKK